MMFPAPLWRSAVALLSAPVQAWRGRLCLALLLGHLGGGGERGRAQGFTERAWDLDEGLPNTCISAIARTRDGFFWLATQAGLTRFDGLHFVTYTTNNTVALKDNVVSCLAVDSAGTLWVGTAHGTVTKYQQGRFTAVDAGGLAAGKPVNAIFSDGRDDLWLATRGAGLVWLHGGARKVFSTANGLPSDDIRQVHADARGRIWYLEGSGNAGWVSGDQCETLQIPSGWTNSIQVIAPARDGGFWLSAFRENSGTRILKYAAGVITEDPQTYPWSRSSERARGGALIEDEAGRLWCGTTGEGIYLREANGRWRKPAGQIALLNAAVLCLYEDQPGSILAGTRNSGLYQLSPRPLAAQSLQDPYKQHVILTMCVRRDGTLWAGTDGAGIFSWTSGRINHFGKGAGLTAVQVYALLEDAQTNLWAGTSDGLVVFRNQRFESIDAPPALSRKVAVLYEDRQRRLWAGTDGGLIGIGGNSGTFSQPDGLPPGQVVAVAEDKAGRFWIAVEGRGLFVQAERGFHLWQSASGGSLPVPHRDDGLTVQPLLPDADGAMWVGIYGHGLARLEGKQLRQWSGPTDGLPSNHLLALQADDAGNIWCSSENGIFGCNKMALLAPKPGGAERPSPVRLTSAEGLPYKVCSGSGQPVGIKTPDGQIWFPDGSALVSFASEAVPLNSQIWPPVIDEVWLNGNSLPIPPRQPLQIQSGLSSLQFFFTSPNEPSQNQLRFSCRLETVDTNWTAEGPERSIKYGALPPGHYCFRVRVRNIHGTWGKEEAVLPFTVQPRWWETGGFRFGVGCGVVGAIALLVRQIERSRSRQKLAAAERARALEQERNRIARDLHDDLGAHLTQVALLGKMAGESGESPDELQAQTQQIVKTSHEMVKSLETIVWAVRPENDSLQRLVHYMNRRTDELFENLPRRCRFTVLGSLPSVPLHAELRHNVYLAFREALTNSLKHSEGTRFAVQVSCENGTCKIRVSDDGKGFQSDAVREEGQGLKNMRLRMEQVGGSCHWQSSSGKGTAVELSFILPSPAT